MFRQQRQGSKDKKALLNSIETFKTGKLKKIKTADRSAPIGAGKVVGTEKKSSPVSAGDQTKKRGVTAPATGKEQQKPSESFAAALAKSPLFRKQAEMQKTQPSKVKQLRQGLPTKSPAVEVTTQFSSEQRQRVLDLHEKEAKAATEAFKRQHPYGHWTPTVIKKESSSSTAQMSAILERQNPQRRPGVPPEESKATTEKRPSSPSDLPPPPPKRYHHDASGLGDKSFMYRGTPSFGSQKKQEGTRPLPGRRPPLGAPAPRLPQKRLLPVATDGSNSSGTTSDLKK